ncbi:F-box protein SKIP16 isoform X3 [Humulus lupulus]|uniref:F-box protein SKIP16 isoform X3 n=1 Tax=Humulus lupulus TaxID=3486 RepID=UPI002B4009F0|nr:F-box protein SKIP16 isoform X3 [Humulus lupulus]
MGLDSLGDLELNIILSNLGAEDTARASCVSKKLRASTSEDVLWSHFCAEELGLSQPLDPLGNPVASFKVSYRLWRESFSMYPWSLVRRVHKCWGRLRNWLTLNFPEAEATLRKGASESEIQEFERILKVKLPLPTRILYRFYNGQEFKDEDYANDLYGSPLGLIGGYTFYNRSVNVYLLPLHQIIAQTIDNRSYPGFSGKSKYIIVAASSTLIPKLFLLNCTNGQLFVGTKNLSTSGEMLPCVPKELIRSVHDLDADQQQDAMLLWLEEHASRLEKGIIKLREGKKPRSNSINQFPEEPPLCSTAVTSGVQVRASAVLIPEFSNLQDFEEKYIFTYSIRMSLLPGGCNVNGMTFESCQLYWRHWVIHANNQVVSDVNGEAVIGKFPILRPGEKEFVYESCTPLPSSEGSVEGYFTFVPGRLQDPKGDMFRVTVAQFPLQLPDYIY